MNLLAKVMFWGSLQSTIMFGSLAASWADQKLVTTGNCSPIFVPADNQISVSFKCSVNIGTTVVYKLDKENTEILANYLSVDSDAVSNLIGQINDEQVKPYELVPHLVKLVEEVKYLRSQLTSYKDVAEAEVLVKEIDSALAAMKIDEARQLYLQLISTFNEISVKQKSIQNLLNIARSNTELAHLEMSSFKYDDAFEHFRNAIDVMPGQFESELIRLKVDLAQAANLGLKHLDEEQKLIDQAEYLTKDFARTDTTLYLRGVGLKLANLVDQGKLLPAIKKFETEVQPLLTEDFIRNHVDLKSLSLCIACLLNAAVRVGKLETGLKFSTTYIKAFDADGTQRPLDLVPILINRSLTLAGLKRVKESISDWERARQILDKYAPDGINPAYPELWRNGLLGTVDKLQTTEVVKQLMVTSVLNYKDDLATLGEYMQDATGGDSGVTCVSINTKDHSGTADQITGQDLAVFEPGDCNVYQFKLENDLVLDSTVWKPSDTADVVNRIKSAYAKTFKEPEEITNAALIIFCTELIRNGWQAEGKELCSQQLPVMLTNHFVSATTAEGAFRTAQWSYHLGYDFGIADEVLFKFAKDAFTKTRGAAATETLDATFNLILFLKQSGKNEEAKLLIDEQTKLLFESGDAEKKKYWNHYLTLLKPIKLMPTPKKRNKYATVSDANELR